MPASDRSERLHPDHSGQDVPRMHAQIVIADGAGPVYIEPARLLKRWNDGKMRTHDALGGSYVLLVRPLCPMQTSLTLDARSTIPLQRRLTLPPRPTTRLDSLSSARSLQRHPEGGGLAVGSPDALVLQISVLDQLPGDSKVRQKAGTTRRRGVEAGNAR